MVPDIHAKFQNQQFFMRRAIKLFLTLFVQNDLKWRTFSITLAKLEPQWPHSEQRSDVIHGSASTKLDFTKYSRRRHDNISQTSEGALSLAGKLETYKCYIVAI